jgi:hypothetical protein
VIADPLFVNPDKGDFRFRSPRAARRIGFRPFSTENAGAGKLPYRLPVGPPAFSDPLPDLFP